MRAGTLPYMTWHYHFNTKYCCNVTTRANVKIECRVTFDKQSQNNSFTYGSNYFAHLKDYFHGRNQKLNHFWFVLCITFCTVNFCASSKTVIEIHKMASSHNPQTSITIKDYMILQLKAKSFNKLIFNDSCCIIHHLQLSHRTYPSSAYSTLFH